MENEDFSQNLLVKLLEFEVLASLSHYYANILLAGKERKSFLEKESLAGRWEQLFFHNKLKN